MGFWDGAAYEIVYGPAAGRSGTVISFTHENDHYVYYLDADGTPPEQWDVMFLRQDLAGVSTGTEWATADPASSRPGSPGSQSLHLVYTGDPRRAAYSFYMDSSWRDGARESGPNCSRPT